MKRRLLLWVIGLAAFSLTTGGVYAKDVSVRETVALAGALDSLGKIADEAVDGMDGYKRLSRALENARETQSMIDALGQQFDAKVQEYQAKGKETGATAFYNGFVVRLKDEKAALGDTKLRLGKIIQKLDGKVEQMKKDPSLKEYIEAQAALQHMDQALKKANATADSLK
ncbi:MAG: hypothetical protein ACOYMV_12555 [Verrucomicrobiia bacterium]